MIAASSTVLVVDSINTDLVAYVGRLPNPGESVPGTEFASFPGGKGANQAVAARRAGATTRLVAAVGGDAYGRDRTAALEAAGVSAADLVVKPGAVTGVALILVDPRGENQIACVPGANDLLQPQDLPADWGDDAVVLVQNEVPSAVTYHVILAASRRGATVIWNPAPAPAELPPAGVLAGVSFLIVNESELAAISGYG